MSDDKRYTDEEARAIIDRALRNQLGREVTHKDLLSMASEVGLSSESIETAARQIRVGRLADEAKQRVIARRRRAFAPHLWSFIIVNAALFAINALTSPGQWWVLFPIVGWGVGLAFHARFGLSRYVSEGDLRRENERMHSEELARLQWSGARELAQPADASRRLRIDPPDSGAQSRDEGDDRSEGTAGDADTETNRSRA